MVAKPLPIVTYPAPVLTTEARPVTVFDAKLAKTLERMVVSMRAAHGVGLAAVQVNLPQRIVVIEYVPEKKEDVAEAISLTVLINPELSIVGDEVEEDTEGCLSLPGLELSIRRARQVRVTTQDVSGAARTFEGTDYFARIVQHEVDHLNGILILDRAHRQRATVEAYRADPAGFAQRAAQVAQKERV